MNEAWSRLSTWQKFWLIFPIGFMMAASGYAFEYVMHVEMEVPRWILRATWMLCMFSVGSFWRFLADPREYVDD